MGIKSASAELPQAFLSAAQPQLCVSHSCSHTSCSLCSAWTQQRQPGRDKDESCGTGTGLWCQERAVCVGAAQMHEGLLVCSFLVPLLLTEPSSSVLWVWLGKAHTHSSCPALGPAQLSAAAGTWALEKQPPVLGIGQLCSAGNGFLLSCSGSSSISQHREDFSSPEHREVRAGSRRKGNPTS